MKYSEYNHIHIKPAKAQQHWRLGIDAYSMERSAYINQLTTQMHCKYLIILAILHSVQVTHSVRVLQHNLHTWEHTGLYQKKLEGLTVRVLFDCLPY